MKENKGNKEKKDIKKEEDKVKNSSKKAKADNAKTESKTQAKTKTNDKKTKKVNIPVYEVNEITEETIKTEEKVKEEKKRKERKMKIQQFKNNFKNFISRYDEKKILDLLVIIFVIITSIKFTYHFVEMPFSRVSIPIIVSDSRLEETKVFNIKSKDSIDINLETYDVLIKKADDDTESIRIKYNKKYNKKISFKERKLTLNIEEKNKIFKTFKFKSKSNLMIIEVSPKYLGKINIKNLQGKITIEGFNKTENEIKEKMEEQIKEKIKSNPILNVYSF